MKYISGIHALNLNCSLDTSGDWHQSGIQWENPYTKDSLCSRWGYYGIEKNSSVPEHEGCFFVANHIRALLDLLEDLNFATANGMRDSFIDNSKYTPEIFLKILELKNHPHWDKIDDFLEKEYKRDWIMFKRGVKNGRLEEQAC